MFEQSSILTFRNNEFQQWLTQTPEKALPWLKYQAEQGLSEAQYVYAQYLLQGFGTKPQPSLAVSWFKAAAQSNHALAMNMLGRCYELGLGVEISFIISTYWYRLSAHAGCDWGMYNYATALALNRGIHENKSKAFKWFSRAAALDHSKSMNYLGSFYEDGWVVQKNLVIAQQYYQRGAYRGDFRAQFNLARLLAEQDFIDRALFWLKKSLHNSNSTFKEKVLAFCAQSPIQAFKKIASVYSHQTSTQHYHDISYTLRFTAC